MNGLSEWMANSLTHSLAHSLDPSLRCKLYLFIYVEITKFDPINYANPRWHELKFKSCPGQISFCVFCYFELEIAFFYFFVYISQKVLHLISKKTAIIALPLAFRIHGLVTVTGAFDLCREYAKR